MIYRNSAAMRSRSNGVTPRSIEKTESADSRSDTFSPAGADVQGEERV